MLLLALLPLQVGVGAPAGAPTAEPAPQPAPTDWAELDAALARLAEDPPGPDGFAWGALVRAFDTQSAREASAGDGSVSTVVLEDVDLFFTRTFGPATWRVSADLGDGSLRLEDAWASWAFDEEWRLAGGQFKPRVVRSASVPPDELLFRERSFLGAAFDAWDAGVELCGHYDQFDLWLALANGANGTETGSFWSARAEWALYDAAFEDREGARDAPNHVRALLGVVSFSDIAQSGADAGGLGVDLAVTFGPWGFHGEWATLERRFERTVDVFNGYTFLLGDGKPLGVTLSRRIGESLEAALRAQSADDADSTQSAGLGLTWRPGAGSARLLCDVTFVETDTRDFSVFSLGLQLGTSGIVRPFLDPR